jgi:gliding motility-associated lipoprotein GldD
VLLLFSCQEPTYSPKPRAYPKVVYPDRSYELFDENYCHFHFQVPTYTEIEQDTLFFSEQPLDPCWFNIYYPGFDCTIHCSYYPISEDNPLTKLQNDAFRLAMEHNRKATYIEELPIKKPNHVSGFIFNLEGPVATPFQFFLTDSTEHFLRGALYFNAQIQPDSLKPLYEFVKVDITHLINTFEWTE